jgi:hypothetical protein
VAAAAGWLVITTRRKAGGREALATEGAGQVTPLGLTPPASGQHGDSEPGSVPQQGSGRSRAAR